jgi:hypothetical protein
VNLYATIASVRDESGTSADNDARIERIVGGFSREVDRLCRRHFYVRASTAEYWDCRRLEGGIVFLPDFLELDSLAADSEGDDTFDGETWVENTDWFAWPDNGWPKEGLRGARAGRYSIPGCEPHYLKASGLFGYGDGTRSAPYDSAGCTGTVATTDGTTLILSVADAVEAGQTILCEDEQMYVSAVEGTAATVRRGVNGTAAAAHAAETVYVYTYPEDVTRVVIWAAAMALQESGKGGYQSESIGDYSYVRNLGTWKSVESQMNRVLALLVKGRV